jgi:hypothetical protein
MSETMGRRSRACSGCLVRHTIRNEAALLQQHVNASRENISELNSIILNDNKNSTTSSRINAPNFTIFSFTRVYFFICSYYHLDPAPPFFPTSCCCFALLCIGARKTAPTG